MKKEHNDTNWDELIQKINLAKESLKNAQLGAKEDTAEVLRRRAKEIADDGTQTDKNIEKISVIEFGLGKERYAFETLFLQEVTSPKKIFDLPSTPDHVYGIINLRGKIVTIIDLKKFLGLNYVGINDSASVIIIDFKGVPVGIVADDISGIKDINKDTIKKPNANLQNIKQAFLRGISNETIIILDIIKLLEDENIQINR